MWSNLRALCDNITAVELLNSLLEAEKRFAQRNTVKRHVRKHTIEWSIILTNKFYTLTHNIEKNAKNKVNMKGLYIQNSLVHNN